jgi:hypothetical protein
MWFGFKQLCHVQIYKTFLNKKPLAVSVDQTVLLGGVSGYMGVYRGNAFTPINLPNFPITRRPDLVSRSYGMLTWYLGQQHLAAGGIP